MAFKPEIRTQITDALKEHGAILPCPRCGNNSWALVDGYILHPISDQPEQLILGGATLPTIGVICTNCGYLALHSIVGLGVHAPFAETTIQQVEVNSEAPRTNDGAGER